MLSKPQGTWPRHGGGQVILENLHPTHPVLIHPSSRNQSSVLPPLALGYHAQDSGGLWDNPALPGFWGFIDGEASSDLAWTPPHLGPAHLRPGLNLWAKATSLSRWAGRELGSSRERDRGQASRTLLPPQICLSYLSLLPASILSRAATGLPDVFMTVPALRGPQKDREKGHRRGRFRNTDLGCHLSLEIHPQSREGALENTLYLPNLRGPIS